jgi:hypothetical protein
MSALAPGHKLITKTIQRHGRYGTYWTCECGNWHPKPASESPWGAGGLGGPRDMVMAYITRQHAKHAIEMATGGAA